MQYYAHNILYHIINIQYTVFNIYLLYIKSNGSLLEYGIC